MKVDLMPFHVYEKTITVFEAIFELRFHYSLEDVGKSTRNLEFYQSPESYKVDRYGFNRLAMIRM